ncbi:MAG: transcription initiation factor IIB [Candidatus Bathyarchaeota archaeon]|nr:transcription initiation factor IIB [Candidatus Bathyarchaeota archaeon]
MVNSPKTPRSQRLVQEGTCPECYNDAVSVIIDSGEVVCNTCGLVLREGYPDCKPEWRAYTLEDMRARTRVGAPSTLTKFDKGLSTTFQPFKDPQGRLLPMRKRWIMLRLRRWHHRAQRQSSILRNLAQAMNVLTYLAQTLHVPSAVQATAAFMYRKALNKDLVRGRSINGIVAAVFYAACRVTHTPRSLKQVADVSTRSRKEISRNYRLLHQALQLTMPIDEAITYVPKIASIAKVSHATSTCAIELLRQASEQQVDVGKAPQGMAAAALYIASIMNGEKTTQKNLAYASGVTEVTVRNRYLGLDHDLNLGIRKKRRE